MKFFRRIAGNLGLAKDGAHVAKEEHDRAPCPFQKIVLKLGLSSDKEKTKAMKVASKFYGVDSISFNMKDKKMTVIGDVDPVEIVAKLRKTCHVDILYVSQEPENNTDKPNKDDPNEDDEHKKDGPKKDKPNKDDNTKKDEPKKDDETKKDRSKHVSKLVKICMPYNPYLTTQYCSAQSTKENPDAYDILQSSTALQTMFLQLLWISSNYSPMCNSRQIQKC